MLQTSPNFNPLLTREEIKAREARRRQLLHRLDASRATTRIEAIEECQRLSPDEIGMLAALSERADTWHLPDWLKHLLNTFIAIGACISLVGVIYGVTLPDFALFPHILEYLLIWFVLALAGIGVNSEYQKSRYSLRVKDSLQQIVTDSKNPDIFPVLMRMLHMGVYTYELEHTASDSALFEAASRWLLRLPTEQIRAYAIRHQALYFFLSPIRAYKNVELTLRVLHILEHIGTSSAIPAVKPLAEDRTLFQKSKEVKRAAQACLNVLLEREKQSRLPEILLRAACAPVEVAATLLHPAAAPPPAPETLLRPLAAQVPA